MAARERATAYRTEGSLAYREAEPARRYRAEEAQEQRRAFERAQRRRNEQARLRRAHALNLDLPYLMVLAAAVCVSLYVCYGFLTLNSRVDARMDSVKSLEKQLERLRAENDALEQSIDTSIDLNEVYRVAITELGMVHAGRESVIVYDKTESEYVRQYENIS